MQFGGEYVFAQGKSSDKAEFEFIPEARYTHKVSAYSSTSADYDDDGEVSECCVTTWNYICEQVHEIVLSLLLLAE